MDSVNFCQPFFKSWHKIFPLIKHFSVNFKNAFDVSGLNPVHVYIFDKSTSTMVGLYKGKPMDRHRSLAIMHIDISHSSGNLTTDSKQYVSGQNLAIPDNYILRWSAEPPSILVTSRFYDHGIISLVKLTILHKKIPCHVDVYSIVVMTMSPSSRFRAIPFSHKYI